MIFNKGIPGLQLRMPAAWMNMFCIMQTILARNEKIKH